MRLTVSRGFSVCRSGRFVLRETRSKITSSLAVSHTTKPELAQQRAISLAQHDAAAGRDHAPIHSPERLQRRCLQLAKLRLTVLRENLRNLHPAALHDAPRPYRRIESPAAAPDRRPIDDFAAAHEADEDDVLALRHSSLSGRDPHEGRAKMKSVPHHVDSK